MNELIMKKLNLVPFEPGCYFMKDLNNTVIYVGKAKRLRNRLRSYFTGSHNVKTTKLVSEIVDFEFIVTSSEIEALILELNLIKKYDPKFNIMLKDDKTYPYLQLTKETHPRLIITRNINENKGDYFGPYPNVQAAKETKYLLDKLYPLRKCHPLESKICLYYHIKQCLGPCEKKYDLSIYEEYRSEIIKILKGNAGDIIEELTVKMHGYAENLQFEKAKEYKDMIDYLQKTIEKQKIIMNDFLDRDIFGYFYKNGYLSIQVFYVRSGKLIERNAFTTPYYGDPEEELVRFIVQFYANGNNIKPKEIYVPHTIDDKLLAEYLQIKVITPKKGEKLKLVELANQNAQITLENKFILLMQNEEKTLGALDELSKLIGIPSISRIEAFDNSHISGNEAIGAMVCYIDGKPSKKDYRKYKIKYSSGNDDYASMREVIYRRYFRVLKDDLARPDLIVIDGGKGQVNVCKAVLNDLNLDIKVIGLIKDDKHKTSELLDGETLEIIPITRFSRAFQLLMNIQEEVHRFAITFHRELRSNKLTKSFLDEIEGIGPTRKKLLLNHFGSVKKIKEATLEELTDVGIPTNIAKNIMKNNES
ncbi:MAG: Excinuclease subunit [Haloplasmataceae bacterium]|jgi:excinuclease ABC subunit C|nr:Excinuclease subunit [Haloplasmataceae bacterium]